VGAFYEIESVVQLATESGYPLVMRLGRGYLVVHDDFYVLGRPAASSVFRLKFR